jgi:hypothetical protein
MPHLKKLEDLGRKMIFIGYKSGVTPRVTNSLISIISILILHSLRG